MVDFLEKQDHGIPAGSAISEESFVQCIHVNGDEITLIEAAKEHYYQPICKPQPLSGDAKGCQHQEACLALRLQMQQRATAGMPGHGQPQSLGKLGAALVTAAFQGLPTGNQQFQGGNNHGQEKW